MRAQLNLIVLLSIFLTPSLYAQDVLDADWDQLPARLNLELGLSDFQYTSQGAGRGEFAAGAGLEFGGPIYRVEAGLGLLKTAAGADWLGQGSHQIISATWATIPVLAKARVVSTSKQTWSLKLGAVQAFETTSNHQDIVNRIDILISAGVSARFGLNEQADLIIEASYNRGLLPALRTSGPDTFNAGTLILAGASLRLR